LQASPAVWAVCFLAVANLAKGSIIEGELPVTLEFAEYVGHFCFDFTNDTDVGNIVIDLIRESQEPVLTTGALYFLIFDDEQRHWKRAWRTWDASTCDEKKRAASLTTQLKVQGGEWKDHYTIRIKERVRPRFWHFAFVACDGAQLVSPLRYKLHARNYLWGWQQELSVDRMGLPMLYGCFTAAFLLTSLVTAWTVRWRSAVQDAPLREHPYSQLLLLSYVASSASCFFFLVHYMLLTRDGHGSMRIRFLGVLGAVVANCTIFLIAILSSVGWAITRTSLPNRRFFLGLITLVGASTALCELRAETTVDQSTQLYIYQSIPGVLVLMLKIFMFCWFAYQTKETYDEEFHDRRRSFYKVLGISMSCWSVTVPVTVIVAFYISPWWRFKVVTIMDVSARFIGQLLLLQLFAGPLSPITAENIFSMRDQNGADMQLNGVNLN